MNKVRSVFEKGTELGDFHLRKDLPVQIGLLPGGSLGAVPLYETRVAGWEFEGRSYDDEKARKDLGRSLDETYVALEAREKENLRDEERQLLDALSGLLCSSEQGVTR